MSREIWYSSLCGSEPEEEEADTERRAFRSWGLNNFFRVRERVRTKPRHLPYFFSIGAKASRGYWTTTKRFPVKRHKGVAVSLNSCDASVTVTSNFLQIVDLKKAIQKQQNLAENMAPLLAVWQCKKLLCRKSCKNTYWQLTFSTEIRFSSLAIGQKLQILSSPNIRYC